MKKLLIGSLLTITAVGGMVSCKSTNYDANPNTDYKYAVNPLDTSLYAVLISSMKGVIDGSQIVFSPAYYKVDSNQVRNITASVRNDTMYYRTFQMYCVDSIVKNKKQDTLKDATLVYSVYDTVMKKRKEYRASAPLGKNIKVVIIEDKDDGMRGVINGKMVNTLPEPGNTKDSVEFKNMYFYFDKRK